MQAFLQWVVALGLFAPLACARQGDELPRWIQGDSECTRSALSHLAAIDTTRLTRIDYNDLDTDASEGMILSAYNDSLGLRVLVATYFGETGKMIDRFYLASAEDFVVDRITLHYSRPIYQQRVPEVVSQERRVVYFCGGRPLEEAESAFTTALSESLKRFLKEVQSRARV